MKILCIRIKNFNSLRASQEIDFTKAPLAQTGIFAITGSTGAGKSSILDAITLALFNKMPRMSNISKNSIDKTNAIITRGEKDAYAEVEYEVQDKVYRSKWFIAYTRNNTLNDYKMELSERIEKDGQWKIFDLNKSEIPKKNEEIIGLNYDQFIKSILLSQGEFALFLKSSANERGELLERITGTEIYSLIGQRIYEKFKEEEHTLNELKQKIDNLELLNQDDEEKLKQEIEENLANLEIDKAILEKLANQKNSLQERQKIIDEQKKLVKEKFILDETEKNLKKDEKKLQLHKKLKDFEPDFVFLEQKFKEAENLNNKLKENTFFLASKTEEQKQLKEKITIDEKKISRQDEFTKLEIQKIKEAQEFDKQIFALEKQISDKEKQYNQENKAIENLVSEEEKIHKYIQELKLKKEKLEIWIANHKGTENLTSDLPVLNENFNQLKGIESDLKKYENSGVQINFPIENWNVLNERSKTIEQRFIAKLSQPEFEESKSKSIEEINIELEKKQFKIKKINEALKLLVDEKEIQSEQKNIEEEGKTIKEELNNYKSELDRWNNEQQIQDKILQELKLKHERHQLEQNFAENRKNLKENEACPLCGSTEHPYVKTYQNKLSEVQNHLKKQEHLLNEIEKNRTDFTVKIETKKTELEEKRKNYTKNKERIQLIDSKIKALVLEIKISEKESISYFEKLLSDFEQEEKNLKEQQNLVINFQKTQAKYTEFKIFKSKVENGLSLELKLKEKLKPYEDLLQKTLTTAQKIEQLKKLGIEYQESITKKEQFSQDKISKGKELELVKGTELEKNKLLKDINRELTNLKQQTTTLKNRRFSLVKEDNLNRYEKELLNSLEKEKQNFNNLKEKNAILLTQIAENQLKKSEYEKELTNLDEIVKSKNQKLDKVLNTIGFNSQAEAKKSILDTKQAEKIQQELNLLSQQISIWKENNARVNRDFKNIEQKISTDKELTEIVSQIEEKEETITKLNQDTGALNQRIAFNEQQKEKSSHLNLDYKKRLKEYTIWENLSDIIGDSKGKKFSKFAQEYTLKQLVKIANKHLKQFSDRYLLLEQAELEKDLMILDSYQGDALRSVNTLSGGETFIISLALALGLADLADSKSTIGSLFIDEGFGSLDQETLDMAMDALEKLQAETNRKIGIISHVESLKERITTQIFVKKISHGYSKLQIIS